MADYTLRNLRDDVENSAEKFGLAPDLQTRFGRNPLEVEGGGFSYQRLAPNYVLGVRPSARRLRKRSTSFSPARDT